MSGIALDILIFFSLSRFLLFSSFSDDGRRVVIMSRGILLLILIIMLMIIIYPLERQLVHKPIVNTAGCHLPHPTCHARMHNSQRDTHRLGIRRDSKKKYIVYAYCRERADNVAGAEGCIILQLTRKHIHIRVRCLLL